MEAKPNIEKIVFNVHGKKLELTADEAKELKQILSDLFGETKVVHEWHHPITYPSPAFPYWHWPYATWGGTFTGISDSYTSTGNAPAPDTLYLTLN